MVSIGPTIGVKGESSYRLALRNIISETKALSSEMDLMVAKFNKYDSAIDKNKQKQEMLSKQIDASRQQLVGYQDAQERMKTKVDELRQKQEKAIQTYHEVKNAQESTTEEIKKAETAMNRASDAVQTSERKYNEWTEKVNKAELELEKLEQELRDLPNNFQIVGDKITEIGDKMADVGEKMTMYITTPLIAAGGAFVKWSSDFTDGMAKIYTIADEGQVPMSEMRQQLIDLSNATGFDLDDLTEAEYQTVSASVETADAVEFLNSATKLARAGFTSTTKSVDVLTTVMNSYGKEVYDVDYISDVLLKTQNDGKTVVDQLAGSLGVIVPLASAYHVGLEDIAAAYATMTKQGVPTTKATTFLRAVFTELEKESSDVNKILNELTGKTFAQLMDEGNHLSDVLGILYHHVGDDSEAFERLFGNVRSSQAVATLMADDFGILNMELERMYNASGQTEKALEVLETPSLKAKRAIQQLKNSGMELGTTLINEMYPYFLKVIDGVKKLTEWFASLDTKTKENIVNFGLLVAGVGPVLTVIGKFTSGIGKFVSGIGKYYKNVEEFSLKITKFSPALGDLTSKIGMALPTVAALTAAYVGVAVATQNAMQAHRDEITALWGLDEKMKDHIETSKENELAYADSKNAAMEQVSATQAQADMAQVLIDKYNDLIDENGEVREGHEKLAEVYFNQLAQALGLEAEDLRELIEENGKFGESIQNTIDDMIRRAEMAAYEQILTDAIYRQKQAEMELEQQEADLVVQQTRVKQAQEKTKKAYEDMIEAQKRGDPEIGRYEQAWRDAVEAESQATAAEAELRDSIDLTRTRVTGAQQDAEQTARKIEEIANTTMEDTADAIKEGGDDVVQEAKNVADRVEDGFSLDGDDMGYYIVKGLADGIDKHAHLASEASARMTRQANAAARYSLSIDSPSKVMAEVGKYFDLGFAKGITDNMKAVENSANMLAESAIGNVYTPASEYVTSQRSINSPISVQVTVNGNADDPYRLADIVANTINVEMQRKMRLF